MDILLQCSKYLLSNHDGWIMNKREFHALTWLMYKDFWRSKSFLLGRNDLGGSGKSQSIKILKFLWEWHNLVGPDEIFPTMIESSQTYSIWRRYSVMKFQCSVPNLETKVGGTKWPRTSLHQVKAQWNKFIKGYIIKPSRQIKTNI